MRGGGGDDVVDETFNVRVDGIEYTLNVARTKKYFPTLANTISDDSGFKPSRAIESICGRFSKVAEAINATNDSLPLWVGPDEHDKKEFDYWGPGMTDDVIELFFFPRWRTCPEIVFMQDRTMCDMWDDDHRFLASSESSVNLIEDTKGLNFQSFLEYHARLSGSMARDRAIAPSSMRGKSSIPDLKVLKFCFEVAKRMQAKGVTNAICNEGKWMGRRPIWHTQMNQQASKASNACEAYEAYEASRRRKLNEYTVKAK